MARIPDLLSGYGPEDEDVIPAGLLDDEEEEGAGPVAPAVGGIAPPPSSAPKSADALLDEAFDWSPWPKGQTPPPMVQAEKPNAKTQGRDSELLRAQRDDARSRNQGRASDALYAAFSRRGLQNTGGGTDTAGELLKRRALEQGEADKTRKAGERMADRAALAKALGVDEAQLSGLSDEGLSKVLGVKVGERKDAATVAAAGARAAAGVEAAKARAKAQLDEETRKRQMQLDDRKEERTYREGRDKEANARADKGKALDTAEGLRKEFVNNHVTKATQEVAASWDKMQRAAKTPSAAGDMALIYGFMKMNDPGSTVREGEFASAQNAGGVDSRVISLYNSVLNGQRLAPEIRADFLGQAKNMYAAQMGRFAPVRKAYASLAEKAGVDPNDVALDLGFPGGEGEASGATGPTERDSAAVKWAKENRDDPRAAAVLKASGVGQ
jgi:hypothetical protein